jgi:riboflavin synthase
MKFEMEIDMFTGIVKDVGRVLDVLNLSEAVGKRVVIVTSLKESLFELGCSVACNGVCLTVVNILTVPSTSETILEFDVGPETLDRTTFAMVQKGQAVHLEPALCVGDSLGGHELSGHVDALGEVLSLEQTQGSDFWRLKVKVDAAFARWCVPQGSIALAGTSLTLARIETLASGVMLEIMLIPHTMNNTHFKDLKNGSRIEVEFDSKVKAIVQTLQSLLPQMLKQSLDQLKVTTL